MATKKQQQTSQQEVARTRGGEERPETTRRAPVFTPATDIYETRDGLVLLVEMPGVEPGSVDVSVERRVLTITGRNKAAYPDDHTLAHAEYRDGDYERSFTLGEPVDPDRIEAVMRNGVLALTLPKAGPAEAKQIKVKSA